MPKKFEMTGQTGGAYMLYSEDGLLDIFLGLTVFMGGILMSFDQGAFMGLTFILLYPILMSVKQTITAPRIDPADMPPGKAATRTLTGLAALGVVFLLAILIFILKRGDMPVQLEAWLDNYMLDTLLAVVVGLLAIRGFLGGPKRLILYGGLLLAARLSSLWLDLSFPQYVSIVGGIISLIGVGVLVRFVRNHPKLKDVGS